jgi:hypothetical protein
MTNKENANILGFYSAIIMAVLAIVTFGIAICTPPVSGPFCKSPCIGYPFTDIISRFPGDYIWMYGAILLIIVFIVLIASIHHFAPEEKRIFSHIGFSFSLIAAIVLITDYFIQISVIQPSLINKETEGIALITQYNPHGIFIALEEIGYIMMSLAFIFLAPVLSGTNVLEKIIRWVFVSGFILIIVAFVLISAQYGIKREYLFEVAAITIDYTVLIVSGILLSIVFRRRIKRNKS